MYTPADKSVSARSMTGAIVVSTYHSEITDQLQRDAIEAWTAAGGDRNDLQIVAVPGAFELPVICATIARATPRVDVIVALGCVIKGETTHDQHINAAVAAGLSGIAVETSIPVGFGLLTCASHDEARARCDGTKGRKGAEAMNAAITTAQVIKAMTPEHVS
jgi:6,7-dimethyl-8-ribityllumazine synthase